MNAFAKRLLTVLGGLFLLAYVGYQAYQMLYTPIHTETVYSATMYETYDTTGITIRNETTLPGSPSGYLFYTAEDGSRVAKDGTIAQIYPSQADAQAQQQLDALDEEIALLKSIQEQGTENRVNLDLITKQLSQTVDALVQQAHSSSLAGVADLRSEMLSLLNKQQVITGKTENFNDRITQLTEQRNALDGSFKKSTGTVSSPVAGYFVASLDGYEGALPFDDVTELTTEQIQGFLDMQVTPPSDEKVGKVVSDYEWYFACNVPITYMSQLSVGASLTVRFPFVSDEEIPVTVAANNRDRNGQMAVVFRCSNMSKELSSMRVEQVQIQLVEHTGLRVPKEAIVTDEAFQTGVYVRVGNTVAFRKIEQEHNDDPTYSICKEIDESGYLRLYDDVILGGKGLYDGKIIR